MSVRDALEHRTMGTDTHFMGRRLKTIARSEAFELGKINRLAVERGPKVENEEIRIMVLLLVVYNLRD